MEGWRDGGDKAKNYNEKCVLSQFIAVMALQCVESICSNIQQTIEASRLENVSEKWVATKENPAD